MKPKLLRIIGVVVCIGLGTAISSKTTVEAQEKQASAQLTTNWVGDLVIAKQPSADRIAGRGSFPEVNADIEVGLRSDGVLIWRKAQTRGNR